MLLQRYNLAKKNNSLAEKNVRLTEFLLQSVYLNFAHRMRCFFANENQYANRKICTEFGRPEVCTFEVKKNVTILSLKVSLFKNKIVFVGV
jgi:hypothetical protein